MVSDWKLDCKRLSRYRRKYVEEKKQVATLTKRAQELDEQLVVWALLTTKLEMVPVSKRNCSFEISSSSTAFVLDCQPTGGGNEHLGGATTEGERRDWCQVKHDFLFGDHLETVTNQSLFLSARKMSLA